MEALFLLWLASIFSSRRKRTYTAEQIEQIKREATAREGGQTLIEAPRRPYRWWRYEGLF